MEETTAATSTSGPFPTTRWTVVSNLRIDDQDLKSDALSSLCEQYRRPLLRYVSSWSHKEEDAEDIIQSFFVRMIEKNGFANAREARGKLRTFLLSSLKNHLINVQKRETAAKRDRRRNVALSEINELVAESVPPDASFDREWAKEIMDRAMAGLKESFVRREKEALLEEIKPFLTAGDGDGDSYEVIGGRLGMTRERIGLEVHRLRKKFGQLVREEIGHTVDSHASVEEELRYFVSLLSD